MAQVTVKVFGVLRLETGVQMMEANCKTLKEIVPLLNQNAKNETVITAREVALYRNGQPCTRRNMLLADGDEIWVLSPAAGG